MLRPLLALVLLLQAAALARCAFTLDNNTATGGTSATGGGPPPTYYMESGGTGWYDGTSNGVPADSCSGTVTWAWTWQGPGPAPTAVILKVEGQAQWSGSGGGCDDGLGQGDTPHVSYAGPTPIGATVSGTKYAVANVGTGGTVSYTISPSASAGYGTCSVGTRVTLTPVTIDFTGPVDPLSAPKLAIGQKLMATVNGAPSGSTYTWSTPSAGAPFANYVASASSGVYTGWAAPATTSSTMSSYFALPASPAISCTIHSSMLPANVTVTKSLTVANPDFESTGPEFGSMQLIPTAQNPTGFYLYKTSLQLTGASDAADYGILIPTTVLDPSFLGSGTGTFGYVQIYAASSSSTRPPNPTQTTSGTGLDINAFPFPRFVVTSGHMNSVMSWMPSDGNTICFYWDLPGLGNASAFVSGANGSYAGTFKSYLMYKPADDANGAGTSVYVPLTRLDWTALGRFDSDLSGNFTGTDSGSSITGVDVYPAFPVWP